MLKKQLALIAAAAMVLPFSSCARHTVPAASSVTASLASSMEATVSTAPGQTAVSAVSAGVSAVINTVSGSAGSFHVSGASQPATQKTTPGKTGAASAAKASSAASSGKIVANAPLTVNVGGMAKSTSVFQSFNMDTYSKFDGYDSIVDRPTTGGQPAYNYSVNLIKLSSDGSYRAYFGGRWKSSAGDGDHVLLYGSQTGAGGTWSAIDPEPLFMQGQEEKQAGKWYSGNVLEPEPLLAADGKWILYTQVEIDAGGVIDTGEKATSQADRIMLLTSADGKNWTRKTDRGVVVNITDPAETQLHHEEVVYVPWDKDKECYWMYVGVNVGGNFTGIYRIRSSDYTTFDFSKREEVSGFSQIGNQIGYLKEAPGGPVFVRITFDGSDTTVPALQFSADGLNWSDVSNDLQGPAKNQSNNSCYFLGLSTLDGKGALQYLGNNTWAAKYAATTCNSPVQPDIFKSAIGGGTLYIHLSSVK